MEENERLRKENDVLSGKVASLEQTLYWLRKKMFGRMSEKESSTRSKTSCLSLQNRNVFHGKGRS